MASTRTRSRPRSTLKVGKVRSAKVAVRGKVRPQGGLAPRALGSVRVRFARFDTHTKRWKRVSLYRKDAKKSFTLRYKFKKRGVWRVTGKFVPKKGFKASKSRTARLKVR